MQNDTLTATARDDAGLASRVDRVVESSPYFSSGRLSIATRNDCVIVEGVVSSYFHKQMAQETLLRVDGVRQIENRLRVARPAPVAPSGP